MHLITASLRFSSSCYSTSFHAEATEDLTATARHIVQQEG